MLGIQRDARGRAVDQKRLACGDVVRDMPRAISGDTLRDHRDRAIIAAGMGGAF